MRRHIIIAWTLMIIGAPLFKSVFVHAQEKPLWPQFTPDSLRQEILTELRKYYADFTVRDWKVFASHFWRGATLATVWQPPGEKAPRVMITTLDEFIAQAPLGPGSKPIFEEKMLEADVRAYGNLAHVWARYAARFGEPGQVMEWRGIDAFTLMNHEGRWKIVSLSYTDER